VFHEEVRNRVQAQDRQVLLAGEGDAKLLVRQWSAPKEKIRQQVSHYRLQRLLQRMELRTLIQAKMRSRHGPGMNGVDAPTDLQRDFCAQAHNPKRVTKITEFVVNGQELSL
jgi:hypothetical protein